jgi:hypothetical protein
MEENFRQVTLAQDDFSVDHNEDSLYIQSTWKLQALMTLVFSKLRARVTYLDKNQAEYLTKQLMRKNIYARVKREKDFYVSKVREVTDKSVIEIARRGDVDSIVNYAKKTADIIEKTALLSVVLGINRQEFQNSLTADPYVTNQIRFAIGQNFRHLRSKTTPTIGAQGITIDERFCRRYDRCNFQQLVLFCVSNSSLAKRVLNAIHWLNESVDDMSAATACVKSAIALESLLVFDQSEPLVKNLCERSAFILSNSPEERKAVSEIVKNFYGERSKVVHGHQHTVSSTIVESMNKLCILMCVKIANNYSLWKNETDLRNWTEDRKMGVQNASLNESFPNTYLHKAIELGSS